MSLWGLQELAPNAYFLFYNFIFMNHEEWLATTIPKHIGLAFSTFTSIHNLIHPNETSKLIRIRANQRIGPHNKIVISILFGSLLGNGHAVQRFKSNGTSIRFFREGNHMSYLLWLHNLLVLLGYCNPNIPRIKTRLGKKGIVIKVQRFNTWTYTSLN